MNKEIDPTLVETIPIENQTDDPASWSILGGTTVFERGDLATAIEWKPIAAHETLDIVPPDPEGKNTVFFSLNPNEPILGGYFTIINAPNQGASLANNRAGEPNLTAEPIPAS